MALSRSAAASALRTTICRQCRQSLQQTNFPHITTRPQAQPIRTSLRPAFTQLRWHSAPASKSQVYDFAQIKQLSDKPSSDRVIIDVREPSEYQAGFIPSAINLPIKSQPDALFLPAHEFEDRFGFEKPTVDQEVVFYCKSGVRSSAAAQLAQQVGYEKVAEYRGSWLDWEKNGGTKGA